MWVVPGLQAEWWDEKRCIERESHQHRLGRISGCLCWGQLVLLCSCNWRSQSPVSVWHCDGVSGRQPLLQTPKWVPVGDEVAEVNASVCVWVSEWQGVFIHGSLCVRWSVRWNCNPLGWSLISCDANTRLLALHTRAHHKLEPWPWWASLVLTVYPLSPPVRHQITDSKRIKGSTREPSNMFCSLHHDNYQSGRWSAEEVTLLPDFVSTPL